MIGYDSLTLGWSIVIINADSLAFGVIIAGILNETAAVGQMGTHLAENIDSTRHRRMTWLEASKPDFDAVCMRDVPSVGLDSRKHAGTVRQDEPGSSRDRAGSDLGPDMGGPDGSGGGI
ncbi:hypothetical protein H2248_009040 [Termitomyces sp. 'cryptogamus']|nr:hypothetical protein H2248_009040 [Termitomyces sp. 'cryptogamus']